MAHLDRAIKIGHYRVIDVLNELVPAFDLNRSGSGASGGRRCWTIANILQSTDFLRLPQLDFVPPVRELLTICPLSLSRSIEWRVFVPAALVCNPMTFGRAGEMNVPEGARFASKDCPFELVCVSR